MKYLYSRSIIFYVTLFFTSFCFHSNGQEKVGTKALVNTNRSEIVLNGLWRFQPASSSDSFPSNEKWGTIWVPGSWGGNTWNKVPGIEVANPNWITDIKKVDKVWYSNTFFVPKNWGNKIVDISFKRVSTDARVYINKQFAGSISWYSGTIDLTKFVKLGKVNTLDIYVVAAASADDIPVLMGTATTQVSFKKSELGTKGIVGDIIISAKPKGIFIRDVFVKTSFRKKLLEAEVEIVGAKQATLLTCIATIVDSQNQVVKTFTTSYHAIAKDTQTIQLSSTWLDPQLWDIDHPTLYTMHCTLSIGGKLIDNYPQSFGFREFWAEGKNFILNGTRINLRPFLEGSGSGMQELIDARMDGLKKNGFNFSEIWPDNNDERGRSEFWDETMQSADKKGYLLAGPGLSFFPYIIGNNWTFDWNKPGIKAQFENRMLLNLRQYRNHPSVVMWTTTGNFFGYTQDQNPLNIGRKNWITDPTWNRNAAAGEEAIAIMKKHDPTRLVFTHHGAYVGDVHTVNFYLNMIPLQEREEWMSEYSKRGQMPFIGVEFGTPLHCTFLRGRNGYGNNIQTEPLVTEFCAIYLGNKAYTHEPSFYRSLIKNHFIKDQQYTSWHGPVEMERMWSFQQIQKLFTTNTWRSWRTYEVSGGMLPWNNGHGWTPKIQPNSKQVNMPAFTPGRKGAWYKSADKTDTHFLLPDGWDTQLAGEAFIQNNNTTLAYIAGPKDAFTAKDHHFRTDQQVQKQLFFFNDTRQIQSASWQCSVLVGDQAIDQQQGFIKAIPVGEKQSIAFSFKLPATIPFQKVEGKIILSATIGQHIHTDTFYFRVYMPVIKNSKSITVFDPVGKTSKMLQALGYKVSNWSASENSPFVIIGREVLSSAYELPLNLENYIANGGKAIVFNQNPDSIVHKRGFRTSPFISRYVFPIDSLHPITKGLDAIDFTNWSGSSSLIEAYPDYIFTNNKTEKTGEEPYYGWHWGNRGGVSTAALEKPHHSAWKPILECEFDMAYSPLMELPYQKGLLVWCALDLEDHIDEDPAAVIVANQLIEYIIDRKVLPRKKFTQYIGGIKQEKLLTSMGLQYQKVDSINDSADLLICGELTLAQEKQVINFASKGGKVLALARTQLSSFMGVNYILDTAFVGANKIPDWDIISGLSLSDIRLRTAYASIKIAGGCETALQGMVAKKSVGKGEIIFTQFNPLQFEADSLTYFRYTRWRQTRALSQLMANLGAAFQNDAAIFRTLPQPVNKISLATEWKVAFTKILPGAKSTEYAYLDTGITDLAKSLTAENVDESAMIAIPQPIEIEKVQSAWEGLDGEMVYRKTVHIQASMLDEDLEINLATLDDFDQVYFNGILVGATDSSVKENWNFNRTYLVPSKLVKLGNNTIAIRIFDRYGGGGFTPSRINRELKLNNNHKVQSVKMYHADYRDDFELGDNPYRYFRW